jgi:uracil-DNA glycosylase|uniref:uracil-DNA glycosylase n=1 Tax=Cyanobium sp. TaxID=2164130 RepID=UPI0040475968
MAHALAPGSAPEWSAFTAACGACTRCGLSSGCQQVVIGRGHPQARLMLIGEAPGATEDGQGEPFVGRSGQLLDQLLVESGLDPSRDVYLCNVVKCRPPDNRKPRAGELVACRPWLDQQIAWVDPPLIGLLGATAVAAVLGLKSGMTQLRGHWLAGEGPLLSGRLLMPIFHPSYLLRNPSPAEGKPKWLTREDLRSAVTRLRQLPASL